MTFHLERDLENLRRELLDMGALVETAVNKAVVALTQRRQALAEEVELGDAAVDLKELDVEHECSRILALHRPVASDLRFVVACLKVNNDLERVGDLAVNIAERVRALVDAAPFAIPTELEELAERARQMLRRSLDAFVSQDTELARQVRDEDDVADELNRRMFETMQARMKAEPDLIERALHVLSSSRNLERIADLATNICEEVVFLVDGEVIRHRRGG